MRRLVSGLALLLVAAAPASGENRWFEAGRAAVAEARALAPPGERARNVIVFLGDGMGISTVTAARILEGQFQGHPGEENELSFERLPHVCLVKTYNTNQQVADSAGTMTAILAGAKTRAGVIGVDGTLTRGDAAAVAGASLPSLFEQAEARGLATGIVSTARVTHATPAAAYAHSPERAWEDDASLSPAAREQGFADIARQLVEWPHGDGLDVVLGGGRRNFLPRETPDPEYPEMGGARSDGRNLVAAWQRRHPEGRYVWRLAEFEAAAPETTPRLLGLFEPSHMRFEADRPKDVAGEPSLAQMTEKALSILSRNPKGYLLLVEAGRIDHAHHFGNAYRALVDTIALSDAVRVAMEQTSPKETLIVVTADHGHVLTIAGYPTRGNPILGKVVDNDAQGAPRSEFAKDRSGLPYTTLGYQNGPGARTRLPAAPDHAAPPQPAAALPAAPANRPDLTEVDTTDPEFRQEAAVGLPAETHSGEDVPVYAGGPGAALFHGVQEQSYLYHAMVEALGWRAPPE